jgi:hypothetical protein
MKRVLILANDFPPKNTVGAERPYSWYKYFQKHGIKVTVVTKDFSYSGNEYSDLLQSSNIIRASSNQDFSSKILMKFGEHKFIIIRKSFTLFYRLTHFFLPVGMHYSIYKAAKLELRKHNYDCILATGEPFILFSYASRLSSTFNIDWYADYRDDWIQNHNRLFNDNKIDIFFLKYERFWEKIILKNVKGFTSVSDFLVDQISKRTYIKNFEVIENGVDLDNYSNLKSPFSKNSFNLVYTGIFYDQPYLEDFVNGFEMFVKQITDVEKIKVYFIGIEQTTNQATKLINEFALKYPGVFEFLPRMSPVKIASYQLFADLLLNFIAGDPEKGLIGAKSYVYASTRNPILTIPTIKNRNSPFFPNRNVQFVAINADEVCQYMILIYTSFLEDNRLSNDLTDDEVFALSREYNSIKMINFMFDYEIEK